MWTFEQATEYFKTHYQFGEMRFNFIHNVLVQHGWSVQLIQSRKQAIWEFTQLT